MSPARWNQIFDFWDRLIGAIRLKVLKMRGAQLGINVKIYGRFTVLRPQNLTIGDHTSINENVVLNCRDKLRIGAHVHVSSGVQIHTGKLNLEGLPRRHTQAPITIDDDVWIASGAVISAGVTIGRNVVIAANAVVVKNVEENSVYAGIPATKIRTLQPPGQNGLQPGSLKSDML